MIRAFLFPLRVPGLLKSFRPHLVSGLVGMNAEGEITLPDRDSCFRWGGNLYLHNIAVSPGINPLLLQIGKLRHALSGTGGKDPCCFAESMCPVLPSFCVSELA